MTEHRRLTWSTAEVAEQLGIGLQRFYRTRQRLRAAGFPEPVPGLTNRYDPVAIEAWLGRNREPPRAVPVDGEPPADADDEMWNRWFDQRIALTARPAGSA